MLRLAAMSENPLKTRLFAGCILAVFLTPPCATYAQGASASLKQADAAYRAGTAAFSRNDFNVAREEFAKVVRLAPNSEQGHSDLGTVLLRLGRTGDGIRE